MAKGQITGKELIADDVITRLAEVDKKLLEILKTYNQLIKQAGVFNTPSGGNSVIKQRNTLDGAFVSNQKEKIRLLKALERQEAKNSLITSKVSVNLAKQRYETQQLNKINKQQAILTSRYADSYDKLTVNLNLAKRELKNLTIEQGLHSKATEKARAKVEALSAKMKQADNVAGDFQKNVGNYPKTITAAVSGLKQLVGAFGAVEVIRIAYDFGKEALLLAKETKGVEFAFERLGETGVKAFEDVKASTRGALADVDIKTALVDFDNFNISLEESATLFEFLAVRSAQTGKSIDSLKDSLVEGLSKESKLRIDNLGISASQLNDELSKTPNFVQAVANIAKTEIAEAGSILDDAGNSAEAFNASWKNLKISIGQALDQFQGSSTIVNVVDRLSEQQKALNVSWRDSGGLLEKLKIQFNLYTSEGRERNRQIVAEAEAREKLDKQIQANRKSYEDLAGALGPLREVDAETGGNGFTLIDPQSSRTVANINEELKELSDKLLNVYRADDAKVIQDKIDKLQKERDAILGVEQIKSDTIKVIEGTIAAYERDIAKQEDFIKTTAKTTEEIKEAENAIIQLKGQIDNLRNGTDKILKIQLEFETGDIIPSDEIRTVQEQIKDSLSGLGFDFDGVYNETQEFFNKISDLREKDAAEAIRLAQENKEFQSQVFGELFSTFSNYYGLDLTAFHDLIEGKKAIEIDYASAINSISNSLLEGRLIGYENESTANQAKLDAILNDENASDAKKLQAQKEYDKKEAELNRKKAQAERDAVLFQISINTAQAVVKSLPNLALAALAATLGAAQLAFVASQPLPQYFLGKGLNDNYEGLATWGEKRKEVLVDEYGGVQVSPNRTTPINVKSSDIIAPSMHQFDREIKNPNSEIFKRVSQRYRKDTVQRTSLASVKVMGNDSKSMERTIERVMSKYMSKPFNINNNVKLVEPRKKYHKRG